MDATKWALLDIIAWAILMYFVWYGPEVCVKIAISILILSQVVLIGMLSSQCNCD